MLTSVSSHLFTVAVFIWNDLPSISYRNLSVTQGFARVLPEPHSCLHTLDTSHLKCHIWIIAGVSQSNLPWSAVSSRLQQFIVLWCQDALMSCCWWWSADCSLSCRVIVKLLLLLYTVVLTQLKPENVFFFFFSFGETRGTTFLLSVLIYLSVFLL